MNRARVAICWLCALQMAVSCGGIGTRGDNHLAPMPRRRCGTMRYSCIGIRNWWAFRLENGASLWHTRISSEGTSVPVLGDGHIYVTAWSPFGQEDHLPPLPTFDEMLKHDADSDGKINEKEFP